MTETEKPNVVFHHNDLDGRTSAAIVVHRARQMDEQVECHPVDYKDPFPFDRIDALGEGDAQV